jgi:hypothetical protein
MFSRQWNKCVSAGGTKSACTDSATVYVKENGPLKGQGLSSAKPSKKKKGDK